MSDDLISRQAVIEELHRYFSDGFDSDDEFNSNEYWNSTHVMQVIANVPNVEPILPSLRCKDETGDTYSRGSNIPKPNKRPPMPPVKHPKEDKRHEQKDACVNCRYYSVDPLSDPCDECIGKAGLGYNRRSAAIEPRKEDENG